MLPNDLAHWLDAAQRAPITKNKVRKDLWANFTECIRYLVPTGEYARYIRVPRAHFVTLQTFCLLDGKGQDTVSNDQLLSFVTTLDELRQMVSVAMAVSHEVSVEATEEEEDHDSVTEQLGSHTKIAKGAAERT
jgi:hypothetical protein